MLIRFVYHFWPEGSGSGNGEAWAEEKKHQMDGGKAY